jgi:hypothetical protein
MIHTRRVLLRESVPEVKIGGRGATYQVGTGINRRHLK